MHGFTSQYYYFQKSLQTEYKIIRNFNKSTRDDSRLIRKVLKQAGVVQDSKIIKIVIPTVHFLRGMVFKHSRDVIILL